MRRTTTTTLNAYRHEIARELRAAGYSPRFIAAALHGSFVRACYRSHEPAWRAAQTISTGE